MKLGTMVSEHSIDQKIDVAQKFMIQLQKGMAYLVRPIVDYYYYYYYYLNV